MAEVALVTPRRFSRTRILTLGRELGLALDHVEPVCLDEIGAHPPFDLAFVQGNEIYPPIGRLAPRNVFLCSVPLPMEDEAQARQMRPFWNDYDLILTPSAAVAPAIGAHGRFPRGCRRGRSRCCRRRCRWAAARGTVASGCRSCMWEGSSRGVRSKRQDLLIAAVRRLVEAGMETELHLAGFLQPRGGAPGVLRRVGLKAPPGCRCGSTPIARPRTLRGGCMRRAGIYWHATGFGQDADVRAACGRGVLHFRGRGDVGRLHSRGLRGGRRGGTGRGWCGRVPCPHARRTVPANHGAAAGHAGRGAGSTGGLRP